LWSFYDIAVFIFIVVLGILPPLHSFLPPISPSSGLNYSSVYFGVPFRAHLPLGVGTAPLPYFPIEDVNQFDRSQPFFRTVLVMLFALLLWPPQTRGTLRCLSGFGKRPLSNASWFSPAASLSSSSCDYLGIPSFLLLFSPPDLFTSLDAYARRCPEYPLVSQDIGVRLTSAFPRSAHPRGTCYPPHAPAPATAPSTQ